MKKLVLMVLMLCGVSVVSAAEDMKLCKSYLDKYAAWEQQVKNKCEKESKECDQLAIHKLYVGKTSEALSIFNNRCEKGAKTMCFAAALASDNKKRQKKILKKCFLLLTFLKLPIC